MKLDTKIKTSLFSSAILIFAQLASQSRAAVSRI